MVREAHILSASILGRKVNLMYPPAQNPIVMSKIVMPMARVRYRHLIALSSNLENIPFIKLSNPQHILFCILPISHGFFLNFKSFKRQGRMRRASHKEIIRTLITTMGMVFMIFPNVPEVNRSGKKAATVVSMAPVTGAAISLTPRMEASRGGIPFCL